MKNRDLISAIEYALIYEVEDEGDIDQVVEMIFDGVVKALQRDNRFPRLARADYDLLFADLARDTCEALARYTKIDTKLAARVIADAVINEMNDHERREDPETDQAAVVA